MQFGTQGMTIAGAKVGHLAHLFGESLLEEQPGVAFMEAAYSAWFLEEMPRKGRGWMNGLQYSPGETAWRTATLVLF